jgi:hypothetical protein
MASLGGRFDPAAVPESERGEFAPMPNGWQPMQIIESDVVDIARGNMLKLTFEIVSGPFANRRVWGQYCIRHESEQAQAIAQRALADMFNATGTPPTEESEDLHFKPFMGRLRLIPAEGEFKAKNEVAAFKPMPGVLAAPPAQKTGGFGSKPATAARPPATVTSGRPPAAGGGGGGAPWRRQAAQQARTAPIDDDIPF